ncbi:helix-turn-helix domain-containing protein [Curtobacterium sp. VKM Ac-1395]|uniref:helix-turn-helix domain-containing protein n=1 Tax=Curtobacterium sp. VKM Ac-1395 TaxID=2783815 RepID=UPI00188B9A94|nr:ArsR family transcriptional regulator [Curtobacterium sp. VKM Ac-1395]MBF4592053.1 ArsR family transcriptional regulator [Curtobacterium sp. VKM Ac-1395]
MSEDVQREAAQRVHALARDLHAARVREAALVDELAAALAAGYAAGIPRQSLATLAGMSVTRMTQYRTGDASKRPPRPFAGVLVFPPYPPRQPPGFPAAAEKRVPGTQSALRPVPRETFERERELLSGAKASLERGMTVRATADQLGISKSVVSRYFKLLRKSGDGDR